MLAPVSPAPMTGALPGYAEPAVAETTRTEEAVTVTAAEDSDTSNAGAGAGADGGAGPQADGSLGATLDAAMAQKAAEAPNTADEASGQPDAAPAAQLRLEAEQGYAEARSAMGMAE